MNSIKRTKPIDSLVIHHTVVPGQDLNQAQASAALNKNQYAYDGKPPYHYIIGKDWDYQARPYDTIGYHAGSPSWNAVSIGIALMGNFNNDTPTKHQEKRLGEVIQELMRVYNIPRHRVFLHKQVRPLPTACPGAKITQEFITNLLQTPMPDTCAQELAIEKQKVVELNNEIGRVTGERDEALTDLAEEKRQHGESIVEKDLNYTKWQTELDLRKKAEALNAPNQKKLDDIRALIT